MENFVGLLYNSGTTQEGLAYKNGFGSTYQVSGGNPGDINAGITITGLTDTISETEGFIFWMKFECTKLSSNVNGDFRTYFFISKPVTNSPSSFTVNMDFDNVIQIGFGNSGLGNQYVPLTSTSTYTTIETGLTYNILVYKNPNKNFTDISAFTTYANYYKYVYPGFSSYSYPNFAIDLPQILSLDTSTNSRFNMRLFNMGMSRTTMTPAQFDLFAQKMQLYDNYWHLFEGETDTPNINKSQLIFYSAFYDKQGNRIQLYPKSDTKFGITLANTNTITLGKNNRWRRPYPPYEPYI
jgi:hypothetical protein